MAAAEWRELDAPLHLQRHLTVASVVHGVAERFGVRYSLSGMIALLHRLRYVDKKAKLIPGKADSTRQEALVDEYEKLKDNKGHDDVILFMDATHPLHNPVAGNGWIKRGDDFPIPSNTGRRRLNIHGVIDIERWSATMRCEERVHAATTLDLLKHIEIAYSQASKITIIGDNARYDQAKAVTADLKNSRIALKFLPASSPNLNLIERFWKFFKRNVLYNHDYPTFAEYKKACQRFFDNLDSHAKKLGTLLTENFEIIRN